MGFLPTEGSRLTVRLPGEVMRCLVQKVVDADRVIVEIDSVPMSKGHTYRMGDKTGARRTTEMGREVWEALDDRDWIANRSPNEPLKVEPPPPAVKKPAPKAKPKAKRVGKGKR